MKRLSCLLTARLILQLKEIQYRTHVVDEEEDVNGVIDSFHQQTGTLSEMQAATFSSASVFDAAILRDFGDVPVLDKREKGKEKEGLISNWSDKIQSRTVQGPVGEGQEIIHGVFV